MPTQHWHQLMIGDPHNLSGESVHAFMTHLGDIVHSGAVLVSDVLGASVVQLQAFNGSAVPWQQFLAAVRQAKQIDWAWFFLFTGTPPVCTDEEKLLEFANLSVRLVDGQYFYVYTADGGIVKRLTDVLGGVECEIRTAAFADLDRPY
jgi:hypothetical protein